MSAFDKFLSDLAAGMAADLRSGVPYMDPASWKVWYDPFVQIPEVSTYWTNTNTNGTLGIGSSGITQTMGGADNDLSQLYLKTATFALVSGKRALFEAKIKVDKGAAGTIGQQEVFVGLAAVATGANFTAADGLTMAVDDCVGFWSPDGSTNLAAIARATDVESIEAAASTYADATTYKLQWLFDGTTVTFYKNGTGIASLTGYPTAALAPMLFIKAGEAKPAVLTTTYVLVATER